MRSYLFVPGDSPRDTAADALVLDLTAAPGGRAAAGRWLDDHRAWVCIHAGGEAAADLRAVTKPGLEGVCVPRARSASEIAALGTILAEAEEAAGLPLGTIPVLPRIETAAGVLAAAEIARAPRVSRLYLDDELLRAELGVVAGPDEAEVLWARSTVVLADAAAGIAQPVGGVCAYPDLLRASTRNLRRLGFGGRACTDEQQVALVNEVFANA
ncbi:aldolase/citrate lyase family protein [Dactylosporangium fulvum]|uniref:Aldolase/citrate lyase family protein n=1 Tax=Dactylosporangium fulvum TaxID=53359 RepID=A0ABY5W3P1_9ACTN|nr:aldolase/citrate lyase family protein [Dactylosporangium fulvum]UWP84580.1 aldolase/citrate lyase family protein [Dactylosporangium fulvum]